MAGSYMYEGRLTLQSSSFDWTLPRAVGSYRSRTLIVKGFERPRPSLEFLSAFLGWISEQLFKFKVWESYSFLRCPLCGPDFRAKRIPAPVPNL